MENCALLSSILHFGSVSDQLISSLNRQTKLIPVTEQSNDNVV